LKKYVFLILAVILAVGMVGGVFAYFTDAETSTGNVLAAGTLDLKISDEDEHPERDGVSTTWSMTNMIPGVSFCGPKHIACINSGTIQGNHLEIRFTNEINDEPDVESDTDKFSDPEDLARWIEIIDISYTEAVFTGRLAKLWPDGHKLVDANGNGFLDLDDLTQPANAAALDNLAPPVLGGQTDFSMTLYFNEGATNDIQGDTLTTTITFILNQSATQ
jgi:spore coat-associated protein N